MKKLSSIFFLVGNLCFPYAESRIPVEVLKIYDGDTINVKIETGNKFSIRLSGIDCFETSRIHRAYKQAYLNKLDIDEVIKKGDIATDYLVQLYKKSKQVSFDFMGVDKYGRVLGIVWFDNINVNNELLRNNICLPYQFKED